MRPVPPRVRTADAGAPAAYAAAAPAASVTRTGCEVVVSQAPLGTRLKDTAARARAPWLMFLRPGVVLDSGWTEELTRLVEHAELSGTPDARAAVFRRSAPLNAMRSPLLDALDAIKLALGARPSPDQGLIIFGRLYERLGGHRGDAADAETDLLARLGRKRIVVLKSGATKLVAN